MSIFLIVVLSATNVTLITAAVAGNLFAANSYLSYSENQEKFLYSNLAKLGKVAMGVASRYWF
jgi:hypothetical protein